MKYATITVTTTIALLFGMTQSASSAGGTRIVATKGQPVPRYPNWPEGVAEIVNDKTRTTGWNSWFTEWPNDVHQYAMEIESTVDLNRLISRLSKVKGKLRQIRLCDRFAPDALGWVTRAPTNNRIPVIFSIGDQEQVDQWFGKVSKPFGVMEFLDTPVAVPPTLTLFVQNPKVHLKDLKIPANIRVAMGYVPTLFHRSNTKRERDAEKNKHKAALRPGSPPSDAQIRAQRSIDSFLRKRRKKTSEDGSGRK